MIEIGIGDACPVRRFIQDAGNGNQYWNPYFFPSAFIISANEKSKDVDKTYETDFFQFLPAKQALFRSV